MRVLPGFPRLAQATAQQAGMDSGLLRNILAVTAGYAHTCALTAGGGIKCWGFNYNGQVGDGTILNRSTPVNVSGLASGVQFVAAGGNHTCALTVAGGVQCWGGETYDINHLAPIPVSGLASGVQAIGAGSWHNCVLTTGGGVRCWGINAHGQVGDGTTADRLLPVDVVDLGNGVQAIAAGGSHTCALTTEGGVKCWGDNTWGQLGNGTSGVDRPAPVDVSGLNSGVRAIAAGGDHTCALTTTGGVQCWGVNFRGQVGDGTSGESRLVPVAVSGLNSGAQAIAAGLSHTCALTTEGGVKCWGDDFNGQLGDATRNDIHAVPEDVNALSSGVQAMSGGSLHTCVLTTAGGVQCWGENLEGQLGDGTVASQWMPVDVNGLANGVQVISGSGAHTCALTTAGGVKCWGSNLYGQLGDGTTDVRLKPVDVSGLANGVQAIAGGGYHACALTAGGGVKCWGRNTFGQLGDGTTTDRSTPVDVIGLTSGVQAITAGGAHTCALTAGGVQCWGDNIFGQQGDGTITIHLTPVDVSGLASGVQAITAGGVHTCALTAGGSARCWGDNSSGQVGDGTTDNRLEPVDVGGLSSGVQVLAAGGAHTCALTSDGIQCWGNNVYGQVGDGTSGTDRMAPVKVGSLAAGAQAITGGAAHTCALLINGGVQCWGTNTSGQLGVNPGWTPVDVLDLTNAVFLPIIGTPGKD